MKCGNKLYLIRKIFKKNSLVKCFSVHQPAIRVIITFFSVKVVVDLQQLNQQTLMMKLVEKPAMQFRSAKGMKFRFVCMWKCISICRPFPTRSLIPFSYLFWLNVFSPHRALYHQTFGFCLPNVKHILSEKKLSRNANRHSESFSLRCS